MMKIKRNSDGKIGELEEFENDYMELCYKNNKVYGHVDDDWGLTDLSDEYTIIHNTDIIDKIEGEIELINEFATDYTPFGEGQKQGMLNKLEWVLTLLKDNE